MKRIIIAMAAIAAVFTMASCNKEQAVSPDENTTIGKSVITASIDIDLTKTALEGDDTEGYKVVWTEGDKLFVADSDFENWAAEFTLDKSSARSSKGTFSWQNGDMFRSIDGIHTEPSIKKDKTYMALYPSDLVDMSKEAYIWKTEQTYSETTGYIPMVGAAECTEDGEAGFVFTNLGGLLRLTVKGTAEIVSITVQANEPMSGEIASIIDVEEDVDVIHTVALMLDETEDGPLDAKHYITLDCNDGVELSSEGTDFYISIPAHYLVEEDGIKLDGYSNVSITLTDTEGNICVKRLSGKDLVIERGKITPATFTASEFKPSIPEGALPGKFSVSADKQVYFSQGNLYAKKDDGGIWSWNFYNEQYDYNSLNSNCKWGSRKANENDNEIDLFTWGYGDWSTNPADDDCQAGAFTDWGSQIGDGNTWRTLTEAEWEYLLGTSTERIGKYKYEITVCDKHSCSVLLPDDWDTSVISLEDFANTTKYSETSAVKWSTMEAAGAVCLPAAGYRNGSDVSEVDLVGYYWSSSAYDEDAAYCVYSYGSSVICFNYRNQGYSVRLVTDVTE